MDSYVFKRLVEIMRCEDCNNYLRPPIYYTKDKNTLCEACGRKTNQTIVGINRKLEDIGRLLHFPCCYNESGCQISVKWSDTDLHENECSFRQFDCPICLDFKETAHSLISHIESFHGDQTLPSGDSIYFALTDRCGYYFIKHDAEMYVLTYNCDLGTKILRFALKYIGPLEHSKRRHYQLILEREDRDDCNYTQRRQVNPGRNWIIDDDTAIKVDIDILKMKLQLKDVSTLSLKIKITSRIPIYNGCIEKDLLSEIECPVCHDFMYSPIKQCVSGHSICNYCSPKLSTCPVCKLDISGVRNFALESICNKMHYKCMYSDDGCKYFSLPKDIFQHENICNYGLHDCPFKSFVGSCPWRGRLDQITIHSLKEHGWKF